MRRRHPHLAVVPCGNDDFWVPGMQFTECPRCGAMADGMLADSGEVFAADCSKCGLPGSTSQLTIWDVGRRRQVETPTPMYLQRAVDVVVIGNVEAEIWQGDVRLAHYEPRGGLHLHAGRCSTEEE